MEPNSNRLDLRNPATALLAFLLVCICSCNQLQPKKQNSLNTFSNDDIPGIIRMSAADYVPFAGQYPGNWPTDLKVPDGAFLTKDGGFYTISPSGSIAYSALIKDDVASVKAQTVDYLLSHPQNFELENHGEKSITEDGVNLEWYTFGLRDLNGFTIISYEIASGSGMDGWVHIKFLLGNL